MKALGLQAYIQPIFIDADMNIIAERVGEAHAKECYNWKAMEDLASGSAAAPTARWSLQRVGQPARRRHPAEPGGHQGLSAEQALTVEQAVRLFTPMPPGPAG